MRKRLFQPFVLTLLLVAALSIFTVSPVSAASTAQVHQANTAASTTLARPAIVVCEYQITAYPGLNVHSEPNVYSKRVGGLNDGQIVYANESTVYGTGYYWHYVYNGNASGWAAANWMEFLGYCHNY